MDKLPYLPSGIAAMRALGNAVNVTVVEEILRELIPSGNKSFRPSKHFRASVLAEA
jgi:hypothetical protein